MTRDELIEFMARAATPEVFQLLSEDTHHDDWKCIADCSREHAARALNALSAAGFVIVPKEPTPEMIRACDDELEVLEGAFVSHSIRDGIVAANAKGDLLKEEPK